MPSLLAMMSRVKEDTALVSGGSGWAAMTGQTRRGLPCVVQKEALFTKTRGASCWQGCTAAQLLAEQAGDTSKAASISFGKEIQSSVFRSRPEYSTGETRGRSGPCTGGGPSKPQHPTFGGTGVPLCLTAVAPRRQRTLGTDRNF